MVGQRYPHARFNTLIDQTLDRIRKLSDLKGGEYAGDVDRLANFRRNGADLELPMETIWRIYAAKHWDAVTQYIKDIQANKTRERLESIDGRIDDLILYLILFKAMVDENNAHGVVVRPEEPAPRRVLEHGKATDKWSDQYD